MEEILKCVYCGEIRIDPRDYLLDPNTRKVFCDSACRSLWYVDNGGEYLGIRMFERGVRLINGEIIVNRNGE